MTARILVVDEVSETQRLMAALLRDAGYWVLTASTLESGQRLAEHADPDLLLIDIRLGVYNGLHLALKQRFSHPARPIIIVSGPVDHVLEREAKRLGAHVLKKPVQPTLLLKTIERLLAQRDSSAEHRWHRMDRRHASADRRRESQAVVEDRRTRVRRTDEVQ